MGPRASTGEQNGVPMGTLKHMGDNQVTAGASLKLLGKGFSDKMRLCSSLMAWYDLNFRIWYNL